MTETLLSWNNRRGYRVHDLIEKGIEKLGGEEQGRLTSSSYHHIIFIERKLLHISIHNTRKQEQCNNVKHEEITLKVKK